MEDITLCRSCFCYVSVNECGCVWQQYFTMFVLGVEMKHSGRGGIEQSCAIRGQHVHFTRSLSSLWFITPHFWPPVWVGGLGVTVGKSWCPSFVVWTPSRDCSNPNSHILNWHIVKMLLEEEHIGDVCQIFFTEVKTIVLVHVLDYREVEISAFKMGSHSLELQSCSHSLELQSCESFCFI